MPFTFSHPAILLPFFKDKRFSITGLVIGAMAPDLEFFFRMRTQSAISHTLLGLFIIDIPLAIIVAVLFHGILKESLIRNSPSFVQSRLSVLQKLNWFDYFKKNRLKVVLSFFLGAFSHFLWDSFTHWDGFMVQRISILSHKLLSFPLYDWGQYGSSVLGLIVLGMCFLEFLQIIMM